MGSEYLKVRSWPGWKDVVLPLHHQCLQVLPPGAQQDPEVQLSAEDSDVYGLFSLREGHLSASTHQGTVCCHPLQGQSLLPASPPSLPAILKLRLQGHQLHGPAQLSGRYQAVRQQFIIHQASRSQGEISGQQLQEQLRLLRQQQALWGLSLPCTPSGDGKLEALQPEQSDFEREESASHQSSGHQGTHQVLRYEEEDQLSDGRGCWHQQRLQILQLQEGSLHGRV